MRKINFIIGMVFAVQTIFLSANHAKADSAREYINRGSEALQKGQFAESEKYFSQAIELNPIDAQTRINRGISFAKQGLYQKALMDFNKAIQLEPDSYEAYFNRGKLYGQRSKYAM